MPEYIPLDGNEPIVNFVAFCSFTAMLFSCLWLCIDPALTLLPYFLSVCSSVDTKPRFWVRVLVFKILTVTHSILLCSAQSLSSREDLFTCDSTLCLSRLLFLSIPNLSLIKVLVTVSEKMTTRILIPPYQFLFVLLDTHHKCSPLSKLLVFLLSVSCFLPSSRYHLSTNVGWFSGIH